MTITITKQGTASWNSSEGIDDKQTTITNVKFTAVKKMKDGTFRLQLFGAGNQFSGFPWQWDDTVYDTLEDAQHAHYNYPKA